MPLGMAPALCLVCCRFSPICLCVAISFPSGPCGIFIGMRFCRRRFWPRLFPQPLGDLQCVDLQILPPGNLIAGLMQLPVMAAAERDGELVADFEAECARLRKPQVMRIGRLPAANEAGL